MAAIRKAKLSEFTPDARNANMGTLRGLAMLDDSLRNYGVGRSILVDKNGKIIAGNKTQERAIDAGINDALLVPTDGRTLVVVQRTDIDLDTPKGRALAIADNRVGEIDLEWNPEVLQSLAEDVDLAQFFDDDELAEILAGVGGDGPKVDPGPQIDRAEELQAKWQVLTGDLWTIGEHRLLCGDSTRRECVERVMQGDKIEMVWTDPPYGVAIGDKNKMLNAIALSNRVEENLTGDTLEEAELVAMLEQSFDNTIAHCTAGAGWYVAAPAAPLHVLFGLALKARGIWRQTVQWVKNNSTFSPLGVCYHWQAEPIFFGWLPNGAHRFYGGRDQTTVWNIDRPLASPEHPTMNPVELVTRAIENSSRRGECVADFFAGSGTTLVACEQTGRRGRGIEISPKYCSVILERLTQMGLTPRRADG